MTQQNMQVDEFDLSDVPEGPSGIYTNYGKLTLSQKWMKWENNATVEVTRDEYKKLPQKVKVKDPDTGNEYEKNAKQIDMVFAVDIQEMKPSLSFTYERKVTVEGLDWNKIIVPSVEAVFGKGSMSRENRNATLAKLNSKYVAYQDVLQTPTKKQPNPTFNTFKLVKVYESREACYADFVASGGNKTQSDNGASSGFDNTVSAPVNPLIPAIFNNDLSAWQTMKGDVQTALASAETPLIEALNKKHAKVPAPLRKGKIEAEMPGVHAQALATVAQQKSAEWETPVSVEMLAGLVGA